MRKIENMDDFDPTSAIRFLLSLIFLMNKETNQRIIESTLNKSDFSALSIAYVRRVVRGEIKLTRVNQNNPSEKSILLYKFIQIVFSTDDSAKNFAKNHFIVRNTISQLDKFFKQSKSFAIANVEKTLSNQDNTLSNGDNNDCDPVKDEIEQINNHSAFYAQSYGFLLEGEFQTYRCGTRSAKGNVEIVRSPMRIYSIEDENFEKTYKFEIFYPPRDKAIKNTQYRIIGSVVFSEKYLYFHGLDTGSKGNYLMILKYYTTASLYYTGISLRTTTDGVAVAAKVFVMKSNKPWNEIKAGGIIMSYSNFLEKYKNDELFIQNLSKEIIEKPFDNTEVFQIFSIK